MLAVTFGSPKPLLRWLLGRRLLSASVLGRVATSQPRCAKRLVQSVQHSEVHKKSKFVVHAASVGSLDEAMVFLKSVSDDRANHNSWAYKSATGARSDDDGEVAGTAGRPILSAIEEMNLTDTIVVVTRFFGGVKLGSSGLVRAYHRSALNCLQLAAMEDHVPTVTIGIQAPMEHFGAVYRVVDAHRRSSVAEDPADTAEVSLQCSIATRDSDTVHALLSNATKGTVRIRVIGTQ